MWEKFGYFESAQEINRKAEELLNEGKTEDIKELCKENGIDPEFAELYMQGEIADLCDEMTAALGKIEVESEDLKLWELMEDWVEYLKSQIVDNMNIATGVRKKEKTLTGLIAKMLEWSSKNRKRLPKEICKAAGVPENVEMGTPGMKRAKQIIREYYGG